VGVLRDVMVDVTVGVFVDVCVALLAADRVEVVVDVFVAVPTKV
jgi:hypothetical protein